MVPIPSHQLSFSELLSGVSTPEAAMQALGTDLAEGDGLGTGGSLLEHLVPRLNCGSGAPVDDTRAGSSSLS